MQAESGQLDGGQREELLASDRRLFDHAPQRAVLDGMRDEVVDAGDVLQERGQRLLELLLLELGEGVVQSVLGHEILVAGEFRLRGRFLHRVERPSVDDRGRFAQRNGRLQGAGGVLAGHYGGSAAAVGR